MARPLHIEFPGALHHLTSRGDGQEDIYHGVADRRVYHDLFADVCDRFNWPVHVFVEKMQRNRPHDRDLSEVPRAQRRPLPKPFVEYARQYPLRDEAIAAAYASGDYTMKAIGEHFNLHYSQVSRLVQKKG
jgi:hypothetical protein